MDKKDVEKITEIDSRSKSNTKRIDKIEKRVDDLSDVYVALTKVNDKVDNIDDDVKEIKKDMKDIKDKPGKRMDQIIGYILSAIIGGIISFIFIKLGMK